MLIKRVDPRTKFLIILFIMISIFVVSEIIFHPGITVLIILLMKWAQLKFRDCMKPVRFLVVFLPLTFLIHFFFTIKGYTVFSGQGWPGYEEFRIPLLFTWRLANIIILTGFALAYISSQELVNGLTLLSAPVRRKLPAADYLFQIFNIALRFFPLIHEEYQHVSMTEKIFHIRIKRRIADQIRYFSRILPVVFVLSLKRAENLAMVMELRGYGQHFPRTDLIQQKLSAVDWIIIGITISGFGCIVMVS